jgi:hypothetical protein
MKNLKEVNGKKVEKSYINERGSTILILHDNIGSALIGCKYNPETNTTLNTKTYWLDDYEMDFIKTVYAIYKDYKNL